MKRGRPRRGVGQHHGELREALLAASLEALSSEGVEALSLREVARRAGVSPSAPYNHFADKNALLAAVAVDGFEKLAQALESAAREVSGGSPLGSIAAAYVSFASRHAAHYRVMFGPEMLAAEAAGPARQAAQAAFERLCGAVAAANPGLDRRAVEHEALLAWALAHGAVELIVGGLLGGLLGGRVGGESLARLVGAATVRLATTAGEG